MSLPVYERTLSDMSCYQSESGYFCHDPNTDTVYFVSDGGNVWIQPENKEVGIAPGNTGTMEELTLQMWRVRVYDMSRRVSHSFRVAGKTKDEVTQKVETHLGNPEEIWEIIARPAGKETFWF